GQRAANAASCALHHHRALRFANLLAALVEGGKAEYDNARVGPRFRGAHLHDFGFGAQRVADEDGLGHPHLVVAQIGDQRAQSGVVDRNPHHQGEREEAVDDDLAEFRGRGILRVEMERLGIVGQGIDQEIVGLGHGAPDVVKDPVAHFPLFEEASRHQLAFSMRTRSAPSFTCDPASTVKSVTVPSNGATRVYSIFIAWSTNSRSPRLTFLPLVASTSTTAPGIGASTMPSEASASPPPRGRGDEKVQTSPSRNRSLVSFTRRASPPGAGWEI